MYLYAETEFPELLTEPLFAGVPNDHLLVLTCNYSIAESEGIHDPPAG